MQEVEEWAARHGDSDRGQFGAAEVKRSEDGLGSMRSYSLALAPQLIHSRSKLVTQLVDSKAFRQIEFLAVGSFYIFQPASESGSVPTLSRIPSTREDVFSNTSIPVKSKRSLMKFLKFVLDYTSESQTELWHSHADEPLSSFLASQFKLDDALQSYIITLTLSHDGQVSVKDGLASINRHLTSMGVFGPGFAAIYPKWGGLSEVAQVGCRAAAVGGAVYMLGSGIKNQTKTETQDDDKLLNLTLTNDMELKTKMVFQGNDRPDSNVSRLSRLTIVTETDLSPVFELLTEGAPTPAASVVAFPTGSVSHDGNTSKYPIYAMVHSSDTGECPSGKYVVYFSTVSDPSSKPLLDIACSSLLDAVQHGKQASPPLFQLYYEQSYSAHALIVDDNIATFSSPAAHLAFNDSVLEPVQEAWKIVMGDSAEDAEYMQFVDREGGDDDE